MRKLAVLALLLVTAAPAAAAPAPKALVSQGDHLFGEYCLGCHGANAQGRAQAPSDATGYGPRRDANTTTQGGIGPKLQGVGALAADFYLRTGYMPLPHVGLQPRRSYTHRLADPQIRALVAYIASFGGPAIPTPHPELGNLSEGQHLFAENCAGCHQVVAQGGYVTGAVPPPLEDATAVQVAEAVRIGPYVMPRFSQQQLSDRQLDSIVRYAEWTKDAPHPGGWAIGYLGPIPEGLAAWFLGVLALVLMCLAIGKRLR
ncbi:MAG TPA: c-type cytochrome [Gaiellaceae bacterium]|nr:c-type cytochrome [Gaiellaceae bacterium]